MKEKTRLAIERLTAAIGTYDTAKANHAETTAELTEAKKELEICARGVVDAENGAVGLFDEVDEEEAPAKRSRRKRSDAAIAAL